MKVLALKNNCKKFNKDYVCRRIKNRLSSKVRIVQGCFRVFVMWTCKKNTFLLQESLKFFSKKDGNQVEYFGSGLAFTESQNVG